MIITRLIQYLISLWRRLRGGPRLLAPAPSAPRARWRQRRLREASQTAEQDLDEGPTEAAMDRMERRLKSRIPPAIALALVLIASPALGQDHTATASRAWSLAVAWEAEVTRQDDIIDGLLEARDVDRLRLDQCVDDPPSRATWLAIGAGGAAVLGIVAAVLVGVYAPR